MSLDGPSLGWEYLRRNPDYQRDWDRARRDPSYPADHWGLDSYDNPDCDARTAQPVWRIDPDALVRIVADDDTGDADHFSLWAVPGRKSLRHDGRRLHLTATVGERVLRMAIASDVCDGGPFAFVIGSGKRAQSRWQAVHEQMSALRTGGLSKSYALSPRPGRLGLTHMRTLQALDGVLAGASHRDIATALFGSDRVAQDWHADSDLRAQVRHLIRRGEAFMRSDYRRLAAHGIGYAYGDKRH